MGMDLEIEDLQEKADLARIHRAARGGARIAKIFAQIDERQAAAMPNRHREASAPAPEPTGL